MALKAIYIYTDHLGRPVLRKTRGDRQGQRPGKDFRVQAARYKHDRLYWKGGKRCVERYQPEWHDTVIYNLPVVLDALRMGKPVWFTEGEADANTVASVGRVAATTVHQGIERMTLEQTRWFLRGNGKSRINIVMDNDDAGAYGAWARYMALLDAGVEKKRLRLWQPVPGFRDVTEAVAAVGYRNALVRAKRRSTRKAAVRYGTARAARYMRSGSTPPHRDQKRA